MEKPLRATRQHLAPRIAAEQASTGCTALNEFLQRTLIPNKTFSVSFKKIKNTLISFCHLAPLFLQIKLVLQESSCFPDLACVVIHLQMSWNEWKLGRGASSKNSNDHSLKPHLKYFTFQALQAHRAAAIRISAGFWLLAGTAEWDLSSGTKELHLHSTFLPL